MIHWCAYCQRFLGEVAPVEVYDFTHGICERCSAERRIEDHAAIERIAPVRALYLRIAGVVQTGHDEPADLLAEGLALGLAPVDLLMGMIQPALYRMGQAWSAGEAAVHHEHALTAACSTLVTLLFERLPHLRALRQAPGPRVLLVNAEGNYHTLGLQVVELLLLSHGVPTLAVVPGLPAREVLALARSTRPVVLGVSVALPTQYGSVREIASLVGGLPDGERPRVVAGGFAVKQGRELPAESGFGVMPNPHDLLEIVGAPAVAAGR